MLGVMISCGWRLGMHVRAGMPRASCRKKSRSHLFQLTPARPSGAHVAWLEAGARAGTATGRRGSGSKPVHFSAEVALIPNAARDPSDACSTARETNAAPGPTMQKTCCTHQVRSASSHQGAQVHQGTCGDLALPPRRSRSRDRCLLVPPLCRFLRPRRNGWRAPKDNAAGW